jgi:hypothetical protein
MSKQPKSVTELLKMGMIQVVDRVILYYCTFDINFTFYYDMCSVKVFSEKHLKMAKLGRNVLRKKKD